MKIRFERLFLVITFSVILLTISFPLASAHEGEGGSWLLSSYNQGNLSLAADSSLAQWSNSRMFELDTLDMQSMSVMSVHNDTYVLFLIQRTLNTPLDQAGVLVAFEEAGENGSDVVWIWTNGSTVAPLDPQVKTTQALDGNELTVIFGRELNSTAFNMSLNTPYNEFVKITSWGDGTDSASVDLETLTHLDFELLPPLNTYPKEPIVIAAVAVVLTLGFILEEIRRYK